MSVKHNGFRVSTSLKQRAGNMPEATRAIARFAGRIMRDAIREQIPPHSINTAWDAYAATGRLQSNVVAAEPEKTPSGWRVVVYVPRYSIKHWRVHEDGAIIRAKGRFLVFPLPPANARYTTVSGRRAFLFQDRNTGRTMVATEYVIIRPKHYWRNGMREGKAIVKAVIHSQIHTMLREYGVTK